MIGSSNFSAFYGNDLTPKVNFPSSATDQGDDPDVKVSSASIFDGITTDKIPVKIAFTPAARTTSYAEEKEPNDVSHASNIITSGDIIYVKQGKKLTVSMISALLDFGDSVTNGYTLTNNLTNEQISYFELSISNGLV